MNVILRHVSRNLNYRALPNLVGTRITVTSVASVPHEVADQLRIGSRLDPDSKARRKNT